MNGERPENKRCTNPDCPGSANCLLQENLAQMDNLSKLQVIENIFESYASRCADPAALRNVLMAHIGSLNSTGPGPENCIG
jgi:hypothetical protein